MIYKRFLDHLKTCGGCTGPRRTEACKYSLPCAIAESLAKKGVVNNSKELISYSNGCRDSSLIDTEERNHPRASLHGIGPCSSD